MPIYVSSDESDPLVSVTCNYYGSKCNPDGVKVHVNPKRHHSSSIGSPSSAYRYSLGSGSGLLEHSGFEWSSGPYGLEIRMAIFIRISPTIPCTAEWAGFYKLGTSGLHGSYANESSGGHGEGIHFGPAAGAFFITAQELANGHIDHAVGINASCANGENVYPAGDTEKTDESCNSADSATGAPHYGGIFQLNWNAAKIAASSYSQPCKVVLTAMATYGAYISDTGDEGQVLDAQPEFPYLADPSEMGADPWPPILAEMMKSGDADSSGNWNSCFNRLSASDFNYLELTPP